MSNATHLETIRDLLPQELWPGEHVTDVRDWLNRECGEPELRQGSEGEEVLAYAMPERELCVHRACDTHEIRTIVVRFIAPRRCPVPGPTGVVLTVSGSGSSNFVVFGFLATRAALRRANLALRANFRAARGPACGACPPPCGCMTNLTAPPAFAFATAVRFGGPRRWLPIGFRRTVTITVTASVVCF